MARLTQSELTVALDAGDAPVAGALRTIYHAGTDRLARIFSDHHLTYAAENPMRADAAGIFADCHMVAGTYRVEIATPRGESLRSAAQVSVVEESGAGALVFGTVEALLSDDRAVLPAATGAIVTAGAARHSYELLAADAADFHLQTAGGARLRVIARAGSFEVDAFGARGDGTSDDTAACDAAKAALVQMGGGALLFGAKTYRVNLVIDAEDRIALRATGQAQLSAAQAHLQPFDPALPAVTVTAPVDDRIRDVSMADIAISGVNAAAFGLRLINVYRGNFTNVSVNGFTDTGLAITNTEGGATAYLDFIGCHLWGPSTNTGATTLDIEHMVTGGDPDDGYTTAINFIGGSLKNGAKGNRALSLKARTVRFANTYVQLNSPSEAEVAGGMAVPIELGTFNGTAAQLNMVGCEIDNPDNFSGVSVQLPGNEGLADYLDFSGSGGSNLVRYADGTTQPLAASSILPYQSLLSWPHAVGSLTLGDGSLSRAEQAVPVTDHRLYASSGAMNLKSVGNVIVRSDTGYLHNRTPASEARMRLQSDGSGHQATVTLGGSGNLDLQVPVGNINLQAAGVTRFSVAPTGLHPAADNTYSVGYAAQRLSVVYAAGGLLITSDARVKEDVQELSAAEAAVAGRLKQLIRTFRRSDLADGRRHIGVIAQEVVAAFAAEGLAADDYAVVRHDHWQAAEEERDAEGVVTRPALPAGERMSVDYDQLLCFVLAAA